MTIFTKKLQMFGTVLNTRMNYVRNSSQNQSPGDDMQKKVFLKISQIHWEALVPKPLC